MSITGEDILTVHKLNCKIQHQIEEIERLKQGPQWSAFNAAFDKRYNDQIREVNDVWQKQIRALIAVRDDGWEKMTGWLLKVNKCGSLLRQLIEELPVENPIVLETQAYIDATLELQE